MKLTSALFNPKLTKLLIWGSSGILMFFVARFIALIPPIGLLPMVISYYTIYLIPLVLVSYLFSWAKLDVKKVLAPLFFAIGVIVSFKLGWFWLTWFFLFATTLICLPYIFTLWRKTENVSKKIILIISSTLLLVNLYWTLNPMMSSFGFFGAGKLITLNIASGYQDDKLLCETSQENNCTDFENTKKYYCSLCVNNLKSCNSCLFFWDNAGCSNTTGKCEVGW